MKRKIAKWVAYFICGLIIIIVAITGEDEKNFSTTGIGSGEQIVEVALSENGNVGGDKYRKWYNGYADNEPWCATFVSWCAEQCGLITEDIIPKFQGCDWGIEWFQSRNLFLYTSFYGGENYTPKTGDLIFFTKEHNKNKSTHVGIVQYVEEDYVVTIEGNTSNSVLPRSYNLTSPYILGYATPEYPGTFNDFSGNDHAEISWNYFISKGCNEYAVAGILGNLGHESAGITPDCEQSNGGLGRGIAQWTMGSERWEGLLSLADANDTEWTSIEVQLEFIWYELNGGDSTTFSILNRNYGGISNFKNAESIEWAVEAFEKSFERSGTPLMYKRCQYAYEYYNLYAK